MGCVMIRIYRDRRKFKEENILLDNEAFFNNNVSPKNLNKASLRIMKDIDKADLIDSNIGTIQTPYGITSIDSLSTGCKTVINYIVIASNCEIYKDVKAICATECGWNALEELFEQIESMGYDIGVIIEHDNKLYNCSDRKYCIDDTTIIDSMLEY